ncbi:hypothetical protein HDV01_001381 [Terramyces sp. JEL0728]|nr:hypothetical protein HDV01_001381 [Terramyces sp. JEL0728]
MKANAKVKKPLNAFFFYKTEKKKEIVQSYTIASSNEISKIAAILWKNEPEFVKDIYRKMSRKAFQEHKLSHPDYVWNVGRKHVESEDGSAVSSKESVQSSPEYPLLTFRTLDEFIQSFVQEFRLPAQLDSVQSIERYYYPVFDQGLLSLQPSHQNNN